jgi:cephalosporin hydroxylase
MVAGGYAYGYLFMSQNHLAEDVFNDLLDKIRPARILEIGTFHGGLTLMLRDIMDSLNLHSNIIRTYDINNQEFLKPLVKDRQVEIFTHNLFNEDYSDFKDSNNKNQILNFLQKDGVSLVLCDGGCKKCEFKLLAPLLKTNDIIMAHDYAPNKEYFEKYMKNRLWDWLEIEYKDIEESVLNYKLKAVYEDITQKAAWCCKVKAS